MLINNGFTLISTRGPEGATFDFMDRFMDRLNTVMSEEVPESATTITVTSPGFGASSSVNSGFGRITLVEPGERERTQAEIANALASKVTHLTDAQIYISQSPTIAVGRRRGLPVQFVIQAANGKRARFFCRASVGAHASSTDG